MNKNSILRSILIIATALFLFASCDKDFNEIGSDIVGDDHFDFLPDSLSTVVAYNGSTGVVQTNNQLINSLGVYVNPVFGTTKANFVTQLQMSTVNPTFDLEKFISLDSVVLTIPYFSKKISTTDGVGKYELDSIYTTDKADPDKISLKVFESGYVLNDYNPDDNFETAQKYFSDQDPTINTHKIGLHLNDNSDVSQNSQFFPSTKEIVKFKVDKGLNEIDPREVESRQSPRMRLHLNKAFFENKIIKAPEGKLLNNSVFKEYFKGLYFQVENNTATKGTMMQLKFSDGDITLYYKEYTSLEDADDNPATPSTPVKYPEDDPAYPNVEKKTAKTFVLKMTGNTVNLLNNQPAPEYSNALLAANPSTGDPKLFVKGGEGSIAIIDLFGPDDDNDGVADELEVIREKKWLINEANLTFYIDNVKMNSNMEGSSKKVTEPQRVYLYDFDNKRPLIDYSRDGSSGNTTYPKLNKYIHDGLIQREDVAGGRGTKYRVRITNHIRNLVKYSDSTNVRLGLVVTESIDIISNSWLKSSQGEIKKIPGASVMNPLGTVLFGNNIPEGDADYNKRLKLEIYYTKPN